MTPANPDTPAPSATGGETPCTCGVGTMFYSHLHPADCPFSRAGVLPPKSREQKLADRLAEIAAAAGKVRDAEYELGFLRYSISLASLQAERDAMQRRAEAAEADWRAVEAKYAGADG